MESKLLQDWTGPFGGVPDWQAVVPTEFEAAFDTAIQLAEQEIQQIAECADSPTFENTLLPLEQAGQTLERLRAVFWVHAGSLNVGPMPALQQAIMPKLAQHADRVAQNAQLFARIKAVYESDAMAELDSDQRRLVEDRYRTLARSGALLDDADKQTLTQINQRLAGLFTSFTQNILDDEADYVTWISDSGELAGLPESVVDAMRASATELGRPQQWAVTNTRSSMEPFLTYADNRTLRQQVWQNFYARGDNAGPRDNKPIIREILQLRAQRAKLLGYETHAHWRLETEMAKTPAAAMQLLERVWEKAVQRVQQEVADMQVVADADAETGAPAGGQQSALTIEPWDYRYYAEKVRKAKYDLDFNEVKPYLQLDKLTEAMLWCATELFQVTFRPATDVSVFHEDMQVWEVVGADGDTQGVFYLDPYARAGKRSGAWMTDYRPQSRVPQTVVTLVSNNSNFMKSGDGPVLISWDDARTLFHEFGHALHGLLSDVRYPSQSGTNVARDFVELPSQLYEHWLSTPEVLQRFCLHYQTGQPMPQELIAKIERTKNFNQGFDTVEYLASALIDMHLHLAGEQEIDPAQFERDTLTRLGLPPQIVMRHRTPQFAHIFADDGYSAGYYSYLWADALTADAAEAFEQAGGYFDADTAARLQREVLSVGDTVAPDVAFRNFRGRDVDPDALLRKRGFPVS